MRRARGRRARGARRGSRRTHRVAVVTNGGAGAARRSCAAPGLADLVHAVFVSGEVGVAKPAPAMFDAAVRWAEVRAARVPGRRRRSGERHRPGGRARHGDRVACAGPWPDDATLRRPDHTVAEMLPSSPGSCCERRDRHERDRRHARPRPDRARHAALRRRRRRARAPGARRTSRALVPAAGRSGTRPGTFTYAAHHAFFAGLPADAGAPGAPRAPLRARASRAARRSPATTCVLDGATSSRASRARGYHTLCIGGVGFFNQQNPLGARAARRCSPRATGRRRSASPIRARPSTRSTLVEALARAHAARAARVPVRQRVGAPPAEPLLPGRRRRADSREIARGGARVRRRAPPAPRRGAARGAARCSRSSAPTTARCTARTATSAIASATRSSGPCRTPRSLAVRSLDERARRHALPGVPLRVPAQDRVPPARARAAARRAVGRASDATRCSSTCTCRSARCAAGSATCSRGRSRPSDLVDALPRRRSSARPRSCGARSTRAARSRSRAPRSAAARRRCSTPRSSSACRDAAPRRRRAARGIPMSVETSPETALPDRLARRSRRGGADRISIGVQSFVEAEAGRSTGRSATADVHRALRAIRDAGVADAQHRPDVRPARADRGDLARTRSRAALAYRARGALPLSALRPPADHARHARARDAGTTHRVALYGQAPRTLLAEPATSRCRCACSARARAAERRRRTAARTTAWSASAAARGRTRAACTTRREYAVGARGVREILERWIAARRRRVRRRRLRLRLDADEQRRRWLILSLLSDDGLDLAAYRARFGGDALADFPELAELARAVRDARRRHAARSPPTASRAPTRSARGSYSDAVRARMAELPSCDVEARHPLPRPARELQLRLRVLPVRQARQTRASSSPRPRRAGERFVAWVARAPGDRRARRPRHAVGRGADPALVPGRRSPSCRTCRRSRASRSRRTCRARSTGSRARTPSGSRCGARTTPSGRRTTTFVAQCARARPTPACATSVGVVGLREHLAAARALRAALPGRRLPVDQRGQGARATPPTRSRAWTRDRSAVRLNTRAGRASAARAAPASARSPSTATARCAAATSSPSRSATSTTATGAAALAPRACTQLDCDCHIGYVHLDYLELDKVFATGLLERIPVPEARAGLRLPVI